MITNPECPVDDLGDARTCPKVGGVARRPGAAKQGRLQPLLFFTAESRRPARQRFGSNGFRSVLQETRLPAPDATAVNPDLAGRSQRAGVLDSSTPRPGFASLPGTLRFRMVSSIPSGSEYRIFIMQE